MSKPNTRVEKLLNLARDPAAYPGERANAIDKANKLIGGDEVPFAVTNSKPYPWQWGRGRSK
jgi:hypothetical protein